MLCASGCRGEIVKRIQLALEERQITAGGADGIYGSQTAAAVRQFQGLNALPPTGDVDNSTWAALLELPPPTVEDRSLQVTAAFEGHGFGLAQGNFDGAGITWGIIGFTLKHGEISKILRTIEESRPDLIEQAFGDRTSQLLDVLGRAWPQQLEWVDRLSSGPGNATLAEPWRSSFARFGAVAEVQAAQLALVQQDYFVPARATAAAYSLRSELGLALAFDIHVQNGGIKAAAQAQIRDEETRMPAASERDLRILIANAVADQARLQYQANVRARKLTLATGQGTVNGFEVTVNNWGLDETPFDQ